MTKTFAEMNYKEMIELANKWGNVYYSQDDTVATDAEYDALMKEIKTIEATQGWAAPASPTQKIGDVLAERMGKVNHLVKMYSLLDAFENQEVSDFITKISAKHGSYKYVEYVIEPKFDGLSLALTYEGGLLKSAVTRGDGTTGEDVTANAKYIKNVPTSIDYTELVEIRGEVVILNSSLAAVNEARVRFGKEPFSNTRNGASGALRSLEGKHTKEYGLHFLPYGTGYNELDMPKHSIEMSWIGSVGFDVSNFGLIQVVNSVEDIEKAYQNMIANRASIDVGLDGMVIKVDDADIRSELGFTDKIPRWAIAYKFPAAERVTKLREVFVSTGKKGILSPVGLIDPVEIDGVTVSRVTLHNYDEIERKDLHIGDSIVVIRSGDVIPKLVKVFADRRDGTEIKIERPTECPACGGTDLDTSAVHIICKNPNCVAKIKGVLSYAVGKKALDMDGLGESAISQLVDAGIIRHVGDLWNLTAADLSTLERFGEKKIANTLNAIHGTIGTTSAERVLNSVEMDNVGQSVTKQLVMAFGERALDSVHNPLTYEELVSLEGIGDEIAMGYLDFMQNRGNLLEDIVNIIHPVYPEKPKEGGAFAGKGVVVTGTLSRARKEFEDMVVAEGGSIKGSVSKNTDYLLCGDNAGSKKEKAEGLGVTVINEEEFLSMIA